MFRKRVTPEMLSELNDYICGVRNPYESSPGKEAGDDRDKDDPTQSKPGEEKPNEGTLILDATCVPQDIRFPTDISLLNEAREKLEKLIDNLHTEGKKPRTYRQCAKRDYNTFIRNRKPSKKLLRKALRKQLGYVRRDLDVVDTLLQKHPEGLNAKQTALLTTLRTLYEQQQAMYDARSHSVDQRIVSISQPWVRPIVRGKTKAPVEFGAKVETSLHNGYARIEAFSWEPFNESTTLIDSVERYRRVHGCYPQRLLADRIFRTRDNLAFYKEHHIRMNGPKLGRPPKDARLYQEQLALERAESGKRSEIECFFGVGKRRYSLNCIRTRLAHTSEVAFHIAFLTMNLFRRVKSLFWLFFHRCRLQLSAPVILIFTAC